MLTAVLAVTYCVVCLKSTDTDALLLKLLLLHTAPGPAELF